MTVEKTNTQHSSLFCFNCDTGSRFSLKALKIFLLKMHLWRRKHLITPLAFWKFGKFYLLIVSFRFLWSVSIYPKTHVFISHMLSLVCHELICKCQDSSYRWELSSAGKICYTSLQNWLQSTIISNKHNICRVNYSVNSWIFNAINCSFYMWCDDGSWISPESQTRELQLNR